MSRAKNRQVLAVLVIMLLLASGQEIYNNLALTATKAAGVVMGEVSNDCLVYGISDEELKQIQDVCGSGKKYDLPEAAIMKYISAKGTDSLEKVIFIRDSMLQKWRQVPRRMGETDENYEQRHTNQDILVQDIDLVKMKEASSTEINTVLTNINFTEYHKNSVKNKYHGEIIFRLRKLGLNQWKVVKVESKPISLEDNS